MTRSLGSLPARSASALRAFEKERYAGEGPSDDEERAAVQELQRLAELGTERR
jgi:hypothetical protein